PAGPPPITISSYIVCTAFPAARFAAHHPRAGLLEQHFLGGDAQLARDDGLHARAAEAALAAAHAGVAAALDAVHRRRGHRAAQRRRDLALGDALAPADHAAVARVLADQFVQRPLREVLHADDLPL